ncbi:hypothetical protein GUITHDRAFT_103096 [Guillardia theta CCMP2712]|uniref:Uncharacterized protein n=1 Tax=Guillardia theta (strain CCMP2712) TaxID=905079 RepID=L1JSL2_GUITC|nr:hypothetical protein GUITHDRAFT_103096 [Guillardia theta CCMP2712]EKX51180.1 hypothetical protein GUITHDRAFT_103096 [Guillardia theta CCMP2712]|eukprot:XP_005838160.1 hypothetical protein GUITHDRAFT_103096 [Guillardia theta CCMP2712]
MLSADVQVGDGDAEEDNTTSTDSGNYHAHYSIEKSARLFCDDQMHAVARKMADGAIDLDSLEQLVRVSSEQMNARKFMLTLDTTFRGANDDVSGNVAHDSWIAPHVHVDASFHGRFWALDERASRCYIGRDIDSISISAHKWSGGVVCGCIVIACHAYEHEQEMQRRLGGDAYVPYLRVNDAIISGSRDGLIAPLGRARFDSSIGRRNMKGANGSRLCSSRFGKLLACRIAGVR